LEKKGSKVSAAAEKRKISAAVLGSDRHLTDDNSLQREGRLGFGENMLAQLRKSCSKSKTDK